MRLIPDVAYVDGRFQPSLGITTVDGQITGLEPAGAARELSRLPGKALLPVNAHCHTFCQGKPGG